MVNLHDNGSLSISELIYRALLFSYPKEFRHQYGSEMALAFRDRYRYARRRKGLFGIAALWPRTIFDLAITAPGEHMEILWQDLRYGVRMLRANIGFTVVAVITLALGIGANTAIFSVVNAVLLQPLPYNKSDQLMLVSETNVQRGFLQSTVAPATYLDWKKQSQSFSDIGAFQFQILNYTAKDGAVRLNSSAFTAGVFNALGVKPVAGRTFTEDDEQPGHADVVVLSDLVWERDFGRDQGVVGRTIQLSTRTYTVIGIMPGTFAFPPAASDVWVPLRFDNSVVQARGSRFLNVLARLKDGVTVARANSELETISSQIRQAYPQTNAAWGANAISLHETLVGNVKKTLYILLSAVFFVLLIACVNVAALLSARMASRQKEIGLRTALGASRFRVIRQLLTESVLLGIMGGIIGILLSIAGLKTLVSAVPANTLPRVEEIGLDSNVLLFTFLISIGTGLVFGLAPAFQTSKTDLNTILKDSGRGSTGGKGQHIFRNMLVVFEIVLSLVLLIGAGLLIRSFVVLRNVDPGFKSDGVLVVSQLVLPPAKYAQNFRGNQFFKDLIGRMQHIPGIQSVGGITALPLQSNSSSTTYSVAGRPAEAPGQELRAVYNIVAADYFQTMSIPLIQGRLFTEGDDQSAPKVALINDALAKQIFPDQNPIGQHVQVTRSDTPFEIVGVVASAKQFGLTQPASPEIFSNYQQAQITFMYLLTKSTGDPTRFAPAIREEVRALDPDQPVSHRTLAQQFDSQIASSKFYTILLGVFGSTALLLAAIGIYGVMSYSVVQRTHEVGIRMALGAKPGAVLSMIIGQGLKLTIVGIVIGLVLSYLLTNILSELLYEVGARDPMTFVSIAVILSVTALVACVIPAYRATRVDPMIALRQE